MEANDPPEWDPAEVLTNAAECLDMYILFAFKAEDCDESYPGLALSYLHAALEDIEDAQRAIRARLANRQANP